MIMISPDDHLNVLNKMLPHALSFAIPFTIIVVSYSIIWYHVKTAVSYLNSSTHLGSLHCLEMRMTKTMLLICIGMFGLMLPAVIVDGAELSIDPIFTHLTYCLYWTQYAFNFVAYAITSRQFRQAYLDFFKVFGLWIKDCVARQPNEVVIYAHLSLMPRNLKQFYQALQSRDQLPFQDVKLNVLCSGNLARYNIFINQDLPLQRRHSAAGTGDFARIGCTRLDRKDVSRLVNGHSWMASTVDDLAGRATLTVNPANQLNLNFNDITIPTFWKIRHHETKRKLSLVHF